MNVMIASTSWRFHASPNACSSLIVTMFFLSSDGGAPAPRRPPARTIRILASDGGAPAPRRPLARTIRILASDGGAPARDVLRLALQLAGLAPAIEQRAIRGIVVACERERRRVR